jgi:hypothetical protein
MNELVDLVKDSPDVIEFLRRQAYANASAQAGMDQSDSMRVEDADRVSTGGRPKSKPPLNLDAVDCADAELAVLVLWADWEGIPYRGWVNRNPTDGRPMGVLYGDLRPAKDIAAWLVGHPEFEPAEGFVDAVRAVRNGNRMGWPELDVFLSSEADFVVRSLEPVLF